MQKSLIMIRRAKIIVEVVVVNQSDLEMRARVPGLDFQDILVGADCARIVSLFVKIFGLGKMALDLLFVVACKVKPPATG